MNPILQVSTTVKKKYEVLYGFKQRFTSIPKGSISSKVQMAQEKPR
jgi:hypothetical protein